MPVNRWTDVSRQTRHDSKAATAHAVVDVEGHGCFDVCSIAPVALSSGHLRQRSPFPKEGLGQDHGFWPVFRQALLTEGAACLS